MANDAKTAIKVDNLSKVFVIPHEKDITLKATVLNFLKKKDYSEFQALKNISFEVKKGEFFGIIGRNGSGKSTLLKILAGIYQPGSKSQVVVNGRLSPFLELGVGFNFELTGRENIYLGGSILGLSRKEVSDKFDKIVRFAELEEFIDTKMKNFSSGMQVRLAFALAINAHAEILLMDEVLAVGDSNFQSKCLEEFNRYREQGKTVVLVTHDVSVVSRYCERALLLRNGEILKIGKSEDVVNEYVKENMSDEEKRILEEEENGATDDEAQVSKAIQISKVEFLDDNGAVKNVFQTGDDIVVRAHYHASKEVEKPVFGLAIYTQDGIHIAGPNTRTSGLEIEKASNEGYVDYTIRNNPFFTGSYHLTMAIYNWECTIPFDFQEKKYVFKIRSSEQNQLGIVKLIGDWNYSG